MHFEVGRKLKNKTPIVAEARVRAQLAASCAVFLCKAKRQAACKAKRKMASSCENEQREQKRQVGGCELCVRSALLLHREASLRIAVLSTTDLQGD